MSGRNETGDERVCTWGEACQEPATYVMSYPCGTFPICIEHTAEARANDPLEYIDAVRSLRSSAVLARR